MPYIQHTEDDRREMLATIGVDSMDDLLSVIPESCRFEGDLNIEPALTEDGLSRHMKSLADRNLSADSRPSFLGGGAYRHFCPALVDSLVNRTEFWTAYTPYQPEASQGTLISIYEWQTMMCRLTGMEVSNASLYDGATAVVEAVMMGLRLQRKAKRVVVSRGVHPDARGCLKTYLRHLGTELVEVDLVDGATPLDGIASASGEEGETAVVILQSPNFYGVVEEVGDLCNAAHTVGALAAVSADPVSLSVLEAPGAPGADMVCGEATGMGNPPWFGGPGVGYLCGRMEHVRQMPARIAGETTDQQGRRAIVLTFQTREQHIRRAKATSNICTSQQLMAFRAALWMALLGKEGFRELGETNLSRSHYAAKNIDQLEGYALAFPERPFFNEFAIRTPLPAAEINRRLLAEHDILGGFDMGRLADGSGEGGAWAGDERLIDDHLLLLAVTDANPRSQIDALADALGEIT